jgi:hypothetical protein
MTDAGLQIVVVGDEIDAHLRGVGFGRRLFNVGAASR